MTQIIDVKLSQDDDGIWDISLDDNGDLATDTTFDTTIATSIFGEKRATADEVPNPLLRRGWIGDIIADVPGFQTGSKSWIYKKQSRIRPDTITGIRNADQEALQYLIDDGLVKSINVTAEQNGNDGIIEEIIITPFIGESVSYLFDAWKNTGI